MKAKALFYSMSRILTEVTKNRGVFISLLFLASVLYPEFLNLDKLLYLKFIDMLTDTGYVVNFAKSH